MKKNIFKLILPGLLVLSASSVIAANIPTTINLDKTITDATNWFFGILLSISAIMIIWAGLEFVLAGGSADKVGAAKKRLTFALIGVVIAFASKGLVALVQTFIK